MKNYVWANIISYEDTNFSRNEEWPKKIEGPIRPLLFKNLSITLILIKIYMILSITF